MKNPFLEMSEGRRIGFFGLGRSNIALMGLLSDGEREITLRSDKEIPRGAIPKVARISRIFEGQDALREIDEDILILSPSVRRDRAELRNALGRGCLLTSDFEIFLRFNKKPIFLVTGSDGKTTTTYLTSKILGEDFPAIGNIGEPMTPHLTDNVQGYVIEASSFMLEYAQPKSRRAAITSLTENHLNWHSSFAEYKAAKMGAVFGAEEAVITADSPLLSAEDLPKKVFAVCGTDGGEGELSRRLSAELCYSVSEGYITENGRRIIPICHLRRQEKYNLKNYLTALAMTAGLAAPERRVSVIEGFGGLPHRGERLGKFGGINFINSSIDTTPRRTMATLETMPEGIIILLGGRDKDLDFSPLVALIKKRGDRAIAYGEAEKKIARAVGEDCLKAGGGLYAAIKKAAEIARVGDTVLLSPAATSYDEFSDFEERGKAFGRWIKDVF